MLDYRLSPTSGRYEIRQYCRPPAVYLDHWAFRRISEDPELRQALASALADRDGTLVIGRLNLLEFTRVACRTTLQDAERLVQDVLPRVFFLDIQIMDVVSRENTRGFGACGDMQMFEYYGKPLLDDFQQWRAIKLFEILDGKRDEYRAGFDLIENKVLNALNEYSTVNRRIIGEGLDEAARRPRATLTLARALVDEIFRDKRRTLDQNDASDMMHTVVPCAYCDYVLVDSEWCDYVERVRRRLRGQQHVAAVYSPKGNGVQRFLDAFRAHPKHPLGVPPWPASEA